MMPREEPHPLQFEAWRAMTPTQKWQLALTAQRMVIDGVRNRLRRQHPDWDEATLGRELSRSLIRART